MVSIVCPLARGASKTLIRLHRKYLNVKELSGAQGRNRTSDTRIFSPLLYRLSYLGTGRDAPTQVCTKQRRSSQEVVLAQDM